MGRYNTDFQRNNPDFHRYKMNLGWDYAGKISENRNIRKLNIMAACAAVLCFMLLFVRTMPVYASYEVTVDIPVSVELADSNDILSNDTVTVTMTPQDDAPAPDAASIAITGEGTGTFEGMTFTKPGDYVYIVQLTGTSSGVTYDDSVYTVTVRVTNSDGGLTADYWAVKDDSNAKSSEIVFTSAAAETYYVVEHYLEQANGSYELEDSYTYAAEAGETVTAVPNSYEHYTENTEHEERIASGVVYDAASGNDVLTLKLYYDFIRYTVTYTDGIDDIVFEDEYYTDLIYGDETPEFSGTPTRDGYVFVGWDKDVADIVTEDVTYVAVWEPIGTETEETESEPEDTETEETESQEQPVADSSEGGSVSTGWIPLTGDVAWIVILGCVMLMMGGCVFVRLGIRRKK